MIGFIELVFQWRTSPCSSRSNLPEHAGAAGEGPGHSLCLTGGFPALSQLALNQLLFTHSSDGIDYLLAH